MTRNRLEAFSDGVLAIAITLLVIEIRPPEVHEGESLAHALGTLWPSYLVYVVSFLTIGVIWLNHHRIFNQIARVDGPLLHRLPPPGAVRAARALHDRERRVCRRVRPVVGVGPAGLGPGWAGGAVRRLRPGGGARRRGAE